MALRSGLLMESTWALDTLNILTFDDNAVTYFGLGNMPGLLEALIEQWRASLIAMFDLTKVNIRIGVVFCRLTFPLSPIGVVIRTLSRKRKVSKVEHFKAEIKCLLKKSSTVNVL